VIATNAAESSVTIPDVDHVICLGASKVLTYNARQHTTQLVNSWYVPRAVCFSSSDCCRTVCWSCTVCAMPRRCCVCFVFYTRGGWQHSEVYLCLVTSMDLNLDCCGLLPRTAYGWLIFSCITVFGLLYPFVV
jgi:hypothetical protein